MADISPSEPVRVTGEERRHPALQKLARAFIALARLRHSEPVDQPVNDQVEPCEHTSHGEEGCREY